MGRRNSTALDRKSKFTLIRKVPSKHAEYKQVSQILDTHFYFANPYHSWERGLNEHTNTNGLIRQYLPKKTDFTQISKEDVINIQEKLNHRPRKVLNYRTPYEVFFEEFAKELAA